MFCCIHSCVWSAATAINVQDWVSRALRGFLKLCHTLREQQASITASAINNSGECRADLRSKAVGHSPNVHEAAQEMDTLGGFGDLPVGTPGAPTQPQSPLHPGLSIPVTHGEHNDVPETRVHQQDTRGSLAQDIEAIYYSLLLCTHMYSHVWHHVIQHLNMSFARHSVHRSRC